MSTIIRQATEIVDLLSSEFQKHEAEFKAGFSPVNQYELNRIMRPGMFKQLDEKKDPVAMREEIKQLQSKFDNGLNEDQRILLVRQNQSLQALKKAEEVYGKKDEELKELQEQANIASMAFNESLKATPELQQLQNQIEVLQLELYMRLEPSAELREDLEESIRSSFGVLYDRHRPKKILSIELPEKTENYYSAFRVIARALERQNIALPEKDENGIGYMLEPDYTSHTLHLIGTEDAPPINFASLRREIETNIKQELAESKWEKIRSTKGLTYEYASPHGDKENLIHQIMWNEWFSQPDKEKQNIRRGIKANGVFHEYPGPPEEEIPSGAQDVMRVSGPAIKTVLYDKLGVRGLEMPPLTGLG